jgi:integrase/recombinase XerD
MLTQYAIQEFMISRGGMRCKTKKTYLSHLTLFQKCFSDLPQTPQPIQTWLNNSKRLRGKLDEPLTPETVHSRFRTLRAFYKQVHLWHKKVKNPMPLVIPPRLRPKVMRTYTEQELFRIFMLPITLRDRTMCTILLDCGPRAQECADLKWVDVHPDYITVDGKTGERDVPISETTYRLLMQLKALSADNLYVFIGKRGHLTYEGIYKTVRKVCRLAQLDGKRCAPHTFRHTFGTEYASNESCNPKALQEIMGHSDFKTTLKYIQNNRKRNIANHRLCSPLKLIASAAQGNLFSPVLVEAEAILSRKSQAVEQHLKD